MYIKPVAVPDPLVAKSLPTLSPKSKLKQFVSPYMRLPFLEGLKLKLVSVFSDPNQVTVG